MSEKCIFEHVHPVKIQIRLRILDSLRCKSLHADKEDCSNCVEGQAGLNLCCAHIFEGRFFDVVA